MPQIFVNRQELTIKYSLVYCYIMAKVKHYEIKGKRVRRKLSDHYVTVIEPLERISLEEFHIRIKKLIEKARA